MGFSECALTHALTHTQDCRAVIIRLACCDGDKKKSSREPEMS